MITDALVATWLIGGAVLIFLCMAVVYALQKADLALTRLDQEIKNRQRIARGELPDPVRIELK